MSRSVVHTRSLNAARSHSPVAWKVAGPMPRVAGGSAIASRLTASGWVSAARSADPETTWPTARDYAEQAITASANLDGIQARTDALAEYAQLPPGTYPQH
jgi:hypothetical protein